MFSNEAQCSYFYINISTLCVFYLDVAFSVPFAFSCSDMASSTVIKLFSKVFSLFGMPYHASIQIRSCHLNYNLKIEQLA